jgi:DNA modification methylase
MSSARRGYSEAELQNDWTWYGHLLESHSWFIDTYHERLLHTAGHQQSPTCIQFSTAPTVTARSPSPAQSEDPTPYSASSFAGAIELGELVALPTGSTVALDDGIVSTAEDAVTYTLVDIPDGSPLLNKLHADVSHLHPRERPDVNLDQPLGGHSITFLNPTAVPATSSSPVQMPADGGLTDPAQPAAVDPQTFTPVDDPLDTDTLVSGDAVTLLEDVQTESIQLACFSPPYNIGKLYGEYEDDVPIHQWYSMMTGVFRELFRALKPDGKVVVNIGKSFSKTDDAGRFFFYPLEAYVKNIALDAGFDFWDEAIWQKRGFHNRGGGALMGSYPDPSNMMITQTHEHVLVFRKWVRESYFNTRELPLVDSQRRLESKLTKDRWRELTQSNWDIETVRQSGLDIEHAAVFPEELPKRAVQLYSFKGDTVLDPFVGTGTTAVAAKRAGRHYIGLDANPEYVGYAKHRLEATEFDEPGYVERR